ncbi:MULTISPECIES: DNA polymerase III subunit gamma and tau [unclassified Rathayibacter]|uniref:DNA polymerase III subunit gamma and tau n=1 Tax=unclassified Rathayibacter TaxID=2609250 RepID=UPI0006F96E24|nr:MULTISPECIES: DNA polymerase III subunit gamma and tau [unclassified Rathayibacter]KQQ03904.1 DNA polymerase III subunit gamma/tau [Rathayibacter sp. Leaf294]KQS12359.1 DNA polymerase III subunit gamma/tau [Rathayibacter sp. Leaf185]
MVAALYRRYRPETFAEMIGQSQVTDPLMTALRTNRVNHAYLFSGPRGCGKTTSARILARCLNCAAGPTDTPCGVCDSCVELSRDGQGSLDVVEIDAASHNGVDDARDLRERAIFAPARDRFKIFILDEAHMVTPQGFNALLKIVEEPPEHVKFIFATTEPDKVIGTIRSRTHHYPFRLVPPAQMLDYTQELCEREGVGVAAGVLPLVVRAGGGSVRDTLSLLDQLMAGSEAESIEYERAVALLGYTHGALLDEVIDALAERDSAEAFGAVDRVIQTGQDPRRFVEDLLERLRDLIVVAATGGAASAVLRGISQDELDRMAGQSRALGLAELSRVADIVNDALTEMTGATSPRLHLELMIARTLVQAGGAVVAPGAIAPAPSREAPRQPVREARAPEQHSAQARPAESRPAAPRPAESTHTSSAAAESPVSSRAPSPASVPESLAAAPRAEAPVASAAASEPVASEQAATEPSESAPAESAPIPEPVAPKHVAPKPEATAAAPTTPSSTAPAAPVVAADEAGGVTLQRMKDSWPEILEVVQKARMTAWLVAYTAQVRALKDDVLTLSFPSQTDVDSFKMPGTAGQPGVSEYLRQAIQQVLGLRVKYIARVEPSAVAPESERSAVEAAPSAPAAQKQPSPEASTGADGWATVAIPADPIAAPDPADADSVAAVPEAAPEPVRRPATAPTPADSDAPPLDEEPPEEDMPPVEPPMPDSWATVAPPGEPAAAPEPVRPSAPAPERRAPAERPATRTTRAATADGRQRYGEAVVREILGAQFIEEQPHVPRGPRVTGA